MAIWTGLRRKPLPVLREVKMGNYRDTPEGEVSIGDTYLIAEFTMPTGKIQAVSFTFPKGFPEDQAAHCGLHLEQMVGRKIKYVFRHTEELWFTFEDGHLWAFCRKPQP